MAVGTLQYDIRNPASNGGGHVQTANKGGTGQTTFTKGDMFVATSSSVVAKLAVGTDGQLLSANSSTASGVQWGGAGVNKISTSASVITIITVGETSVSSATIPGSILGTSGAIRSRTYISNMNFTDGAANASVLVKATYGGGVVSSIIIRSSTTLPNTSFFGTIDYTLIANNSASLQRGILQIDMASRADPANVVIFAVTSVLVGYNTNTSSVESSANQTFGVTIRKSAGAGVGDVTVDGNIIEKIV